MGKDVSFICENCGAEVDSNSTMCPKCGTNFSTDIEFICDNCGTEISSSDAFCPKCGKKFINDDVPITFEDNNIIYDGKTIYGYDEITKIKKNWNEYSRGKLELVISNNKINLYFYEYDEMDKLCTFLLNKNSEALKKEHRFKCNVCGNIFCYTGNDILENERRERENVTKDAVSGLSALSSIISGLFGSRYDMYEEAKISNSAANNKNKIIDYSKCPMCGSRDLIEITNESISTEKNSLNNIEEIKKLKELLDDGIISQKEFEKKKKQLLDL